MLNFYLFGKYYVHNDDVFGTYNLDKNYSDRKIFDLIELFNDLNQ